MNKYSFWKLYLAQWSWKNECKSAMWYIWPALLVGTYKAVINDPYYPLVVHYLTVTVMIFASVVFYQLLKLIVMAIYCKAICMAIKNDNKEAVSYYDEALVWRKQP